MPPLVEASALLLVPRPQRLRQADGSAPADLPVEERTVGGLRPEGFRLAIRPDGITLEHRDDRGRRDGRATLDQIRRQSGDHLSCLTIEDWPDLPTRGFVLDISRDRVPTRATLARHARRPRLAGGELTGAHGIELVPNQNCFGHMERWLRHDAYRGGPRRPTATSSWQGCRRSRRSSPRRRTTPPSPCRCSTSCCPTSPAARSTSAATRRSSWAGVSKAELARRGREAVYAEHLLRIAEPLVRRATAPDTPALRADLAEDVDSYRQAWLARARITAEI